ncbi:MAG TPA: hypothetical protein VFS88_08045, partial [Micavibrio sp.]|nr:hypothetical protein [Micavibrio sp.]
RQFRVLLVSISVAALAACSGGSSGRQAKSSAPLPPIAEMDTAMASPAPLGATLTESDTLTPIMPQAPVSGSMEERLARLEQSVNALQSDYQKIMPAFASLNTTNERIQTLLGDIEKEKGLHVAAAEKATVVPVPVPAPAPAPAPALAPTAIKTVTTTETPAGTIEVVEEETVPATGVIPPAGSVSRAAPVKTVTDATTTVTTTSIVANESAPPLSSIPRPTAEEARAEAARQTQTAAPVSAAALENSVTGVRIGEHGSKTRLVFDLKGKAKPAFKYDLDNAEKLLLVDMAATGWAGGTAGRPKSPLIDSWAVTESVAGGSSVAIQLKKSARVISTQFLGPEGKDPARLVVDIAPQG